MIFFEKKLKRVFIQVKGNNLLIVVTNPAAKVIEDRKMIGLDNDTIVMGKLLNEENFTSKAGYLVESLKSLYSTSDITFVAPNELVQIIELELDLNTNDPGKVKKKLIENLKDKVLFKINENYLEYQKTNTGTYIAYVVDNEELDKFAVAFKKAGAKVKGYKIPIHKLETSFNEGILRLGDFIIVNQNEVYLELYAYKDGALQLYKNSYKDRLNTDMKLLDKFLGAKGKVNILSLTSELFKLPEIIDATKFSIIDGVRQAKYQMEKVVDRNFLSLYSAIFSKDEIKNERQSEITADEKSAQSDNDIELEKKDEKVVVEDPKIEIPEQKDETPKVQEIPEIHPQVLTPKVPVVPSVDVTVPIAPIKDQGEQTLVGLPGSIKARSAKAEAKPVIPSIDTPVKMASAPVDEKPPKVIMDSDDENDDVLSKPAVSFETKSDPIEDKSSTSKARTNKGTIVDTKVNIEKPKLAEEPVSTDMSYLKKKANQTKSIVSEGSLKIEDLNDKKVAKEKNALFKSLSNLFKVNIDFQITHENDEQEKFDKTKKDTLQNTKPKEILSTKKRSFTGSTPKKIEKHKREAEEQRLNRKSNNGMPKSILFIIIAILAIGGAVFAYTTWKSETDSFFSNAYKPLDNLINDFWKPGRTEIEYSYSIDINQDSEIKLETIEFQKDISATDNTSGIVTQTNIDKVRNAVLDAHKGNNQTSFENGFYLIPVNTDADSTVKNRIKLSNKVGDKIAILKGDISINYKFVKVSEDQLKTLSREKLNQRLVGREKISQYDVELVDFDVIVNLSNQYILQVDAKALQN